MKNSLLGKISLPSLIYLILIMTSCSSNQPKIVTDFNETYQKGTEAFNKKKWDKAIEYFTLVVLNNPGSDLADDAQFYIGECYFNRKEYLLAIAEYQKLTERYPYSSLVEDASYKIALSQFKNAPQYQLDQEYTLKALQSFQDFVETYSNSKYRPAAEKMIIEIRNRLGRKLFESGRLYRKLREWESAIIYFDKVFELYYDTDWVMPAYLEKAYCLIRLRRFDEYEQVRQILNSKYKERIPAEQMAYLQLSYNREKKQLEKELKKNNP